MKTNPLRQKFGGLRFSVSSICKVAITAAALAFITTGMLHGAPPPPNLVAFRVVWSGKEFGNNAFAVATITIDTSRLPNPGSVFGEIPASSSIFTDVHMTVTGASSGNGTFTAANFVLISWDTNGGTLDLTRELVGQPTSDKPWGTHGGFGYGGEFNLDDGGGEAPSGVDAFRMETSGGVGDLMALVSFAPASSAIVQYGDAAAGLIGEKFKSFSNPFMNASGQVAFAAKLSGSNAISTSSSGIWADDSTSTRQLIVLNGTTAPDARGAATSAMFAKLGDPVYNDNNAVAFLGTLTQNGPVTARNDTGIWSNDFGVLHLVAREGDVAPGTTDGAHFKTLTQFALPNRGGVVLLAQLDSASTTNLGIWAVDTTGTLQLIARKGSADPITGKTIKVLSFLPVASKVAGQTRSFAQATGDLLYSATFADRTGGIYRIVIP